MITTTLKVSAAGYLGCNLIKSLIDVRQPNLLETDNSWGDTVKDAYDCSPFSQFAG